LSCHTCRSLVTGGGYQFTSKEVRKLSCSFIGYNKLHDEKNNSGNISVPSLWHTMMMLLITATNTVKAGLSSSGWFKSCINCKFTLLITSHCHINWQHPSPILEFIKQKLIKRDCLQGKFIYVNSSDIDSKMFLEFSSPPPL